MSGSTKSYRDLMIWQRGMDLVAECYGLTANLPDSQRFGLVAQIRRASVSIPANIAEGYGRETDGPFSQHLRVAQGSLKELETHLLLLVRLRFTTEDEIAKLMTSCDELGRMIRSMLRTIRDRS